MPRPDLGGFSRCEQAVPSILSDGLGHPVPDFTAQRLGIHQGLIYQLREEVQNLALLDALPGTDGFGGLHGPPPSKDG